jgi:signal transduction histidine kinase
LGGHLEQGAHIADMVPLDARTRGSPWEAILFRMGGRWGVITIFTALYALLYAAGYEFKESLEEPTVMWPAAGLLFSALWLSDRSFWPAYLLVHAIVAMSFSAAMQSPFAPGLAFLLMLSNALDAIVGASVARWLITERAEVRTAQTLQMLLATAIGSLAGAVTGAAVNVLLHDSPLGYMHQMQMWWAGNWLGSLTVVPVVFCWIVPLRMAFVELALRSRIEALVIAVLLLVSSVYVFRAGAGGATSLLQLPIIMIAVLMYAAYRMPPRWAATMALFTAFICAELASELKGPFVAMDPFIRTAQVQTFLATIAGMTFVMSTSLTEMRIALGRLRESELRYRNFVELSTEAVWRVELERPMPVSLPVDRQVEWLREYGRVAECNLSYRQLDPAAATLKTSVWQREVPWHSIYEQHLEKAAGQGYSMDGLRFTAALQGRSRTFLTSFSGVVRDAHLQRIWGVARDITELVELNARLLREQDRLKSYARQIVTAEEKARRATAVDLHDGIGQSLVGMSMTLEVAREHAPPDVRMLIDEVRARLREVQERTRHMISDLSPPGLYDLGLAPALQWLSVYVRGHDRLHVELDARVREDAVKLEMRVLVFKLVRELLRNVVKHAGVNAARVTVRGDGESLQVEVADQGKGFEWQMDMFGARSGGFGLWSIADRVHEAGGQFTVDTAPGRGARFEMSFPLRALDITGEQQALSSGFRA